MPRRYDNHSPAPPALDVDRKRIRFFWGFFLGFFWVFGGVFSFSHIGLCLIVQPCSVAVWYLEKGGEEEREVLDEGLQRTGRGGGRSDTWQSMSGWTVFDLW